MKGCSFIGYYRVCVEQVTNCAVHASLFRYTRRIDLLSNFSEQKKGWRSLKNPHFTCQSASGRLIKAGKTFALIVDSEYMSHIAAHSQVRTTAHRIANKRRVKWIMLTFYYWYSVHFHRETCRLKSIVTIEENIFPYNRHSRWNVVAKSPFTPSTPFGI